MRIDIIYIQFAKQIFNKYNIKIDIEYTKYINNIINSINISKLFFIDSKGTIYKINKPKIQLNTIYRASIINLNDI